MTSFIHYLLDTNIWIAAIKKHPLIVAKLETCPRHCIKLSSVVLGELEFGAEKSQQKVRNKEIIETIAIDFEFIGMDYKTTKAYASLRQYLEANGTPIGANDMWIAAQALSTNTILVTNNVKEFSRIPDLKLENWLG